MDVSIIIVNYNTKALILNCIKSIYQFTHEIKIEIIVSDNCSIDGSIDAIKCVFPDVVIIDNKKNLGFGAANNRAKIIAKGKYILFLNSDTELQNNSVKIFYDYFENNAVCTNIGALGCNLMDMNNCYTHSYGFFPTNKNQALFLFYLPFKKITQRLGVCKKKIEKQLDAALCVDYLTGADLFMRNDENAFFDENFFLYFEETDLQFQLNKMGLKRVILQDAKIKHIEMGSRTKTKNISLASLEEKYSRIYFLHKNMNRNIYYYFCIVLSIFYIIMVKAQIRVKANYIKKILGLV